MEEIDIITEEPKSVRIGKKTVLIQQLTFNRYFKLIKMITKMYFKHAEKFIKIYNFLKEIKQNDTWNKKFMTYIISINAINKVRKDIIKLLDFTFPSVGRKLPFTKSYLEKNLTPNILIKLLIELYQYNFGALKKNFQTMLKTLDLDSQTLTSFSKGNSDGDKENVLKPRYRRLSTIFKDGRKVIQKNL